MSASRVVTCALSALVPVVVLCGCTAVTPRVAPTTATHARIDEATLRYPVRGKAATPDLFVTEFFGSEVFGYLKTGGSPVETLSGFGNPEGLALDAQGNLYVADSTRADVAVFAPGATTPFLTIAQPSGGQPYGVAVDAKRHVWVANNRAGKGDLVEFDRKGNLLQTISCAGLHNFGPGIAVDAVADLFVVGTSGSGVAHVEEIAAGKSTCTELPPRPYSPGGLAVTSSGDLVVGDNTNYDAFTYAAPTFQRIIAKANLGGGSFGLPIALALTKDNATIWAANYPGGAKGESATAYPYPHGSSGPKLTIDIAHGALGIAVKY